MSHTITPIRTRWVNAVKLIALAGTIAGAVYGQDIIVSLLKTGVLAGVYGSAVSVPVITVDDRGRITAIASAPIVANAPVLRAGPGIEITGSAPAATVIGMNSASQRQFLSVSESLTFLAFPPHTCRELPVPFPGAMTGEGVIPHWPLAMGPTFIGVMFVSSGTSLNANGIVTVRVCNVGLATVTLPAGLTFTMTVAKW